MGLISAIQAFFWFFRSIFEVSLIIIFGYFVPIIETLATIRQLPENQPIPDSKLDSLVGLWTGIVCFEGILIPVDFVKPVFVGLWSRLRGSERRAGESCLPHSAEPRYVPVKDTGLDFGSLHWHETDPVSQE